MLAVVAAILKTVRSLIARGRTASATIVALVSSLLAVRAMLTMLPNPPPLPSPKRDVSEARKKRAYRNIVSAFVAFDLHGSEDKPSTQNDNDDKEEASSTTVKALRINKSASPPPRIKRPPLTSVQSVVEAVLLDADGLCSVFNFLEPQDQSAAAVCKPWSGAWTRHLIRLKLLVHNAAVIASPLLADPTAVTMLPDGRLCVADAPHIAILSLDRRRVERVLVDPEAALGHVLHLRSGIPRCSHGRVSLYALDKIGRMRRFGLNSGKVLAKTDSLVSSAASAGPTPPGYALELVSLDTQRSSRSSATSSIRLFVCTRHDMCLLDPETLAMLRTISHGGMANLRGMVHAPSDNNSGERVTQCDAEAPCLLYVGTWSDGIHVFSLDGKLLRTHERPHDTGLSDLGLLCSGSGTIELVVLCHHDGCDRIEYCSLDAGGCKARRTRPVAKGLRGASPFRMASDRDTTIILIFAARRSPDKVTVETFTPWTAGARVDTAGWQGSNGTSSQRPLRLLRTAFRLKKK